jgi:hypothetical protein
MAYGMLVMALLTFGAHAVLVRRPPATADDVLEEPMSEFVEQLPGEGA